MIPELSCHHRVVWKGGCSPWAGRTAAFTLIELLVVMAILLVLAVILVPQIRIISKDRTLRETARAVSATLVDAIERARVEGAAGVALVRNPRFYRYVNNVGTPADSQGARVFYACYSLYQLKAVPPYVGNFEGDVGYFYKDLLTPPNVFEIYVPAPLDANVRIDVGTYLYLGRSPNRYRIIDVQAGAPTPMPGTIPPDLTRVQFVTEVQQSGQYAGNGATFSFKITRRPKPQLHTEVNLPRGYIINLNYSGPLQVVDVDANDFTWTEFTLNLPVVAGPPVFEMNAEPVLIFFDSDGSIESMLPNGYLGPRIIPAAAVNLCIAPDDYRHSFPLSTSPAFRPMPQSYYENPAAARDVLNDPDLMWVSVDHRTGYVGVGPSVPPIAPVPNELSGNVQFGQIGRMLEAWRISGQRNQAAQ